MGKLNLKIISGQLPDMIYLVNGKRITDKRNKFGNIEEIVENNNDFNEIEMVSFREINGKCWFFLEIILYFISIFGIFDVKKEKKGKSLKFKMKVQNSDNVDLKLIFNPFENGKEALRVESNGTYQIIENSYFIDEKIVKKLKTLKITKILIFILLVVLIFVIL